MHFPLPWLRSSWKRGGAKKVQFVGKNVIDFFGGWKRSIFFSNDPPTPPFGTGVPTLVGFWRFASGSCKISLSSLVNTSTFNERSKIRTIADHKISGTVGREPIRKHEEHTHLLSITKVQDPAHESVSENTKSIHAFCQSQKSRNRRSKAYQKTRGAYAPSINQKTFRIRRLREY